MTKRFDVTFILNYYAPYVSGLTETARIVAEGLAKRGKRVAVVATRHDKSLPKEDMINGVHVFRAPVAFKIGRGPVSPAFVPLAHRIARQSRVVNLHLPMLEASLISGLVRDVPIVSTYHIDLWLAPTFFNRIQIAGVNMSARYALRKSAHVVVNSDDQAKFSIMWPTIKSNAWSSISAPCLDPRGGRDFYRDGPGYHVGFLGRIVPDKGIEFLIKAFLRVASEQDRLLLGGAFDMVAGGSNIEALKELINGDPRVKFLGLLNRSETRDFYASIDTFALTSVAESFGIVQAEAMMCDVPVVGSDLPGGRVPLLQTGFGELTKPGDVPAIADALLKLKAFPEAQKSALGAYARELYGLERCIECYDALFESVASDQSPNPKKLNPAPAE